MFSWYSFQILSSSLSSSSSLYFYTRRYSKSVTRDVNNLKITTAQQAENKEYLQQYES
jgi:hypothetical protein